MALLELSDGLSNEAWVSLGNKLVCSKAVTTVAPPADRPLICDVSDGGGGGEGGRRKKRRNKARGAGTEEVKKGGDEMSHATCFVGAFTFHFSG